MNHRSIPDCRARHTMLWLLLACSALLSTGAGADEILALTQQAREGNSASQFELANRYLSGNGVAQSQFDALHWFREAAANGNHNAQYNLAVMYLNGMGVVENTEEALRWFRAAADNGDATSQYNLGVFYANGVYGLDQDIQQAWIWFTLAGAGGISGAASNAVLLQEFMSAEQIRVAQDMAREQINLIQGNR